ncbi:MULTISPECIES: hypothetical protein [unclassified Cupriavidus]|uniref:hypothetical protein n=1 Tax=unclassified Cupriavidus TaxID=2640874 RepID=UPI001C004F08|nr:MULTISPECIES: hypothetical protein [unclassified Cupriavidus]MCA3183284.1 hypothetical protein [Cupriavidus sp.]MCA3191939.1 hypothetical protein [Cupriavidus sp.]MCA3197684.1 hypothetical protein [Cupriavidus sp.]MCA3202736.1 hypothetical protein [Cupriavidus sp.]MCA3208934.1 hypothetical protein [Cupriavidus sp.]
MQDAGDANFSCLDDIERFRAARPCRYLVSLCACSRAARAFIVAFPALCKPEDVNFTIGLPGLEVAMLVGLADLD